VELSAAEDRRPLRDGAYPRTHVGARWPRIASARSGARSLLGDHSGAAGPSESRRGPFPEVRGQSQRRRGPRATRDHALVPVGSSGTRRRSPGRVHAARDGRGPPSPTRDARQGTAATPCGERGDGRSPPRQRPRSTTPDLSPHGPRRVGREGHASPRTRPSARRGPGRVDRDSDVGAPGSDGLAARRHRRASRRDSIPLARVSRPPPAAHFRRGAPRWSVPDRGLTQVPAGALNTFRKRSKRPTGRGHTPRPEGTREPDLGRGRCRFNPQGAYFAR
jgi:hypothetical protein